MRLKNLSVWIHGILFLIIFVTIDEYGYPLIPNAIQSAGYWSTLGVADMLPKYFDVEDY